MTTDDSDPSMTNDNPATDQIRFSFSPNSKDSLAVLAKSHVWSRIKKQEKWLVELQF